MLPSEHRLTDGELFRAASRRGSRCGSSTVVTHLWVAEAGQGPPRVGFVVSRGVGNAVVRNRVKRRLRHLARELVTTLPGSAVLVVRALPAAAVASSADLAADLARCVERASRGVESGRRDGPHTDTRHIFGAPGMAPS